MKNYFRNSILLTTFCGPLFKIRCILQCYKNKQYLSKMNYYIGLYCKNKYYIIIYYSMKRCTIYTYANQYICLNCILSEIEHKLFWRFISNIYYFWEKEVKKSNELKWILKIFAVLYFITQI